MIRLSSFGPVADSTPVAVSAVAAAPSSPWLLAGLLAGLMANRRSALLLITTVDVRRSLVLPLLVAALNA